MGIEQEEFLRRVESARRRILEREYVALIAYSAHRDYRPGNVMYLGNFFGKEEEQNAVVITQSEEVLLTDSDWDVFRARETCPVTVQACPNLSEGITEVLKRSRISEGKVAVAGWNYLPTQIYLGMRDKLPKIELRNTDILDEMRSIKSPAEIALMRQAARITDLAHEVGMKEARPGRQEWEVVAAAIGAILLEGARTSLIPEFGSGVRTTLVAPQPTDKIIQDGDLCLLDMGAAYQGYHGDIARMKVAGKATVEQKELLSFEYEVLKKTLGAIRPGVKASEIHKMAKKPIAESGFEKHGGWTATGHGNGLETHEWPYLDQTTDARIQEGMVLCVEPSFTVPDVGTFRLEQMVLVTDSGCETLTKCRVDYWS
jgi:Xaa-Pro aminopeptidase